MFGHYITYYGLGSGANSIARLKNGVFFIRPRQMAGKGKWSGCKSASDSFEPLAPRAVYGKVVIAVPH